MQPKPYAYYEARIAFGAASLLPALLLPGYALLGWLIWASRGEQPDLSQIASAFELVLPLSAGLLAGHLMSIEREEDFDDVRRTYPEPFWRLPLLRAIGAAVLTIVVAVLASGVFRLAYGDYSLVNIVLPALPPTLYLMGLSLLLNNVTGNYWVSVAVVMGYWLLDYRTQGSYTGILFLFRSSIPLPDIDYDLNRFLLLVLGLAWVSANIFFNGWRRKYSG